MRLEEYLRVVQKRWWMIALIALTAAAAAYGFSKTQQRMYRSQVRYVVFINRLDSGARMFAESTLNSYVNLIYTPGRLESIAQQLKIDQSGSAMMQFVRIQPQPNESQIVIEADYYDPATSQQIADAVGQMLNATVVEKNRTLQGEDRLSLDPPQPAQYVSSKPNARINVLAGAILGGILGILLVFVLEYLDDTLKNAADVERYSNLPTIGAIPSGAAQGSGGRPRIRPVPVSGFIMQPPQRNRNIDHDE